MTGCAYASFQFDYFLLCMHRFSSIFSSPAADTAHLISASLPSLPIIHGYRPADAPLDEAEKLGDFFRYPPLVIALRSASLRFVVVVEPIAPSIHPAFAHELM
jgi:hypothetical protein